MLELFITLELRTLRTSYITPTNDHAACGFLFYDIFCVPLSAESVKFLVRPMLGFFYPPPFP
jgi:hypothetical protein